jgi:hypothetical protein
MRIGLVFVLAGESDKVSLKRFGCLSDFVRASLAAIAVFIGKVHVRRYAPVLDYGLVLMRRPVRLVGQS